MAKHIFGWLLFLSLAISALVVTATRHVGAAERNAPAPAPLPATDPPAVGQKIDGASDVKTPEFFLAWGQKGDKPGEFYSPICITINKKDEVYVAD
jgi:hypothetical protein